VRVVVPVLRRDGPDHDAWRDSAAVYRPTRVKIAASGELGGCRSPPLRSRITLVDEIAGF